jgi:hypothetical protein
MTPAEVNGRIKAFVEGQNRVLEGHDTLAWMIGSYVAQGYHNPKKYPKKPDMVKTKPRMTAPMEDDDIKAILTTFAQVHNVIEEGKNGGNAGRTTD